MWRRKIRCMKRYPGWVLGIRIGRYSSHACHHHCEVKASDLLEANANIIYMDKVQHIAIGAFRCRCCVFIDFVNVDYWMQGDGAYHMALRTIQ